MALLALVRLVSLAISVTASSVSNIMCISSVSNMHVYIINENHGPTDYIQSIHACSMHGYFSPCMFHAGLFQSMHAPCRFISVHACSMQGYFSPCMFHAGLFQSMYAPCRVISVHACSMQGYFSPCMVFSVHACSMHGYSRLCTFHALYMHVTGNHAWNVLEHACFRCSILSRVVTPRAHA